MYGRRRQQVSARPYARSCCQALVRSTAPNTLYHTISHLPYTLHTRNAPPPNIMSPRLKQADPVERLSRPSRAIARNPPGSFIYTLENKRYSVQRYLFITRNFLVSTMSPKLNQFPTLPCHFPSMIAPSPLPCCMPKTLALLWAAAR